MKKSKLYNDLVKNDAFGTGLSYEDLATLTNSIICPIKTILVENNIYARDSSLPYGNDSTYLTFSQALPIYFPNVNGQAPDEVHIFSSALNQEVPCIFTWDSNNSALSIQLDRNGGGKRSGIVRTDSSVIVYVYWTPML